jgi:hypothetical protein
MTDDAGKPPLKKEPTKKEANKPHDHNDDLPGIWVGGGHVISDHFGELYGTGPMRDDELPIELQKTPLSDKAFFDDICRDLPQCTPREIVEMLIAAGGADLTYLLPPEEPQE